MAKEELGDPAAKPVDAPTARRRQDAIGRRLRQMYEDVVREDVPDEFMQFLEDADSKGAGGRGNQRPPEGNGSSTK